MWVAGADGCRGRWCVVLRHTGGEVRARLAGTFADLLALPERPVMLGVDMPIGLPEATPPGGRACDRAARALLGARARSVLSPVGRLALKGTNRAEADRLSRAAGGIGVGAQAWGLAAALRQADGAMTPERQETVREVHPELSFRALNDGVPMPHAKTEAEGARERTEALVAAGFPPALLDHRPRGSGLDDFLDACAVAWTAGRILAGTATRLPREVDRDARGLDQAIWF